MARDYLIALTYFCFKAYNVHKISTNNGSSTTTSHQSYTTVYTTKNNKPKRYVTKNVVTSLMHFVSV